MYVVHTSVIFLTKMLCHEFCVCVCNFHLIYVEHVKYLLLIKHMNSEHPLLEVVLIEWLSDIITFNES